MAMPRYSVVIARVASADRDRLAETLQALERQDAPFPFEVLVVDRVGDFAGSAHRYPHARWIAVDPSWTIPRMRTRGAVEARGEFVVVTEDHCVPPAEWLRSFDGVFAARPDADVVGGCVLCGLQESGLDAAAFLSEYAALLPPFDTDHAALIAGMNTAYRRASLIDAPRERLEEEFWELELHADLARAGRVLVASDRISTVHRKRFPVGLAVSQRFAYSRHYAGRRFEAAGVARRLVGGAARLALPALLAWRTFWTFRSKRVPWTLAWRAAPWLAVIYVAWTAGEIAGALLGPGDSLRRIE